MKKHKQWITIIGYFSDIPIRADLINRLRYLLNDDKNILVMIKKEDHELNPKYTQKEKFDSFCEIFPNETKTGKIILSAVPDIIKIEQFDF
jgi:hypothetical protein